MELETQYEASYPAIAWRTPLPIKTLSGVGGLGCRFCIAIVGLKGHEVFSLPKTEAAFKRHMQAFHNREAIFKGATLDEKG